MKANNITCILGDFKDTIKKELEKINSVDLVFIDGNHQEEATISYFKQCKYSNNNTTLFLTISIGQKE